MSTELLGVWYEGHLLGHLIVLEFRNLVCSSASCTFPGEAIAVVCLLSPTELMVVLVKSYQAERWDNILQLNIVLELLSWCPCNLLSRWIEGFLWPIFSLLLCCSDLEKLKSCPRLNVSASLILFCCADGCGGRNLKLSSMLLVNSWCHTCFLPRGFDIATLSTESTSEALYSCYKGELGFGMVCPGSVFPFGSSSCGREQTVLELFLEALSPHRFVVPVGRQF